MGEPVWYVSSPGHARGFCGVCGSNLFWRSEGSGLMSVFAGTLDVPTGLTLAAHIYVAAKSDYYTVADGQPQVDGGAELDLPLRE